MSPPFTRPSTPSKFYDGTSPPKARLSNRPATTIAASHKPQAETPNKTSSDAGGSSQPPPPRPPNAWILYRSHKIAQLKASLPSQQGTDSSHEQSGDPSNGDDSGPRSSSPSKPLFNAALAALAEAKGHGTMAFTAMRSSSPTPSLSTTDAASTAISTSPSASVSRAMPPGAQIDQVNDKSVSAILAELWKTENQTTKRTFYTLAEQKKEEHRAAWPDYKYSPRATQKSIQARERRRNLGMRDKRSRDPEPDPPSTGSQANASNFEAQPTGADDTSDPNVTPTKRQAVERALSPRSRVRAPRSHREGSHRVSASPSRASAQPYLKRGSVDLSAPSSSRRATTPRQQQSLPPTSSGYGANAPLRRSPRLRDQHSAERERANALMPIVDHSSGTITTPHVAQRSPQVHARHARAGSGTSAMTAANSHSSSRARTSVMRPGRNVASAHAHVTHAPEAYQPPSSPLTEDVFGSGAEQSSATCTGGSAISPFAREGSEVFLTAAAATQPAAFFQTSGGQMGSSTSNQQETAPGTNPYYNLLDLEHTEDASSSHLRTSHSSTSMPFNDFGASQDTIQPWREPPTTAVDIFGDVHGTLHQAVAADPSHLGWSEAASHSSTAFAPASSLQSSGGGVFYESYNATNLPTPAPKAHGATFQDSHHDQDAWALARDILEGNHGAMPGGSSAELGPHADTASGMDLSFEYLDFPLPAASTDGLPEFGPILGGSSSTEPDPLSWLCWADELEPTTSSQIDPQLEAPRRTET